MAPLTSDIGSIPQPCGTILIHLFSNQVMPDITADGDMLGKLASLAGSNPQVQVLWLYGSRAKGTHDPASDWDLAVAFDPVKQDGPLGVVLENRLRPELLALEWQRALGLADGALSVLDINQAPIPLAFAVVAANHLLYSRDEGRRLQEEARIMSRQEIDFSSAAWANYSSNESSDNAYISALRISLSRYQAELSEIRTILAERALSNLEYRAAERTLQVTIEACIGVSKHWARALAGHTPQDAYQAFEILSQRGELAADSLLGWRKIIGLRNALVHDYLNIDPDIIRSVIGQGYSDQLFTFAHQGLDWLAAHLGKLPYV